MPRAPYTFLIAGTLLVAAVAPTRAEARQDRSRSDDPGDRPAVSEPAGSATPARASTAPSGEAQGTAAGTIVAPVRPRSVTVADKGVIELGASTAPRGRWKGFPISLSLRDAPLPEVLRSFARLAGFNLVLDPRVQGEVTVELKDVPWDQALHVILKTHGMGAEVDGRVWMVGPQ